MNKLTDKEYEELKQRVADGKRVLYTEKHDLSTRERNEWTNIFFSLQEEMIRQTILRGTFSKEKKEVQPWRVPGETPDEYVYRMRVKLGLERPKRKEAQKEDTQNHLVRESQMNL